MLDTKYSVKICYPAFLCCKRASSRRKCWRNMNMTQQDVSAVASKFLIPAASVDRSLFCQLLGVIQDNWIWYYSIDCIRVPITMALSCLISKTKRDILVENRDFSYPTCIRRPRYGGLRQNIVTRFGMEKITWCGYPTVRKCLKIAVSIQCRRVTDGQTYTETDILRQHCLLRGDFAQCLGIAR